MEASCGNSGGKGPNWGRPGGSAVGIWVCVIKQFQAFAFQAFEGVISRKSVRLKKKEQVEL
jgi:hypothetical protein